jgi:hypothetical protein
VANLTWIGNAHDVKQITTITVANTWAAGDTAIMTINGKDLTVTCGSTTTTTATVASAIKEAWMSSTRLDGTSASSNATSNVGGQEFGEFSEVTASVSGSVVTLIANTAGVPFTLTVTEVTAGSGTAVGATATAATGSQFWNNADNWDTGSVPVDDDVVIFRDSNVSCRYGLPNGTDLEATLQVWMSYTGEIGLPKINETGKPYYEYRQRYVRLDDGGTGTNIAHRFGLGNAGTGSRLINLKHITVKCSPVVYNTGEPLQSRIGTKALNICCTANTSTLVVAKGSVDCSSQDSGTSAFLSIKQTGGDVRAVSAVHTTGAVVNTDGNLLLGGTTTTAIVNVRSGTTRIENQTAELTEFNVFGGDVDFASGCVIDALKCFGGLFDARNAVDGATLNETHIYEGAKFRDPAGLLAYTADPAVYFDPSEDLQFGASIDQPIGIGA